MKDFYVYLHRKATTGEIFYVGKGRNDRCSETENRNKHWRNVVDKHGFNVEIVYEGLQEWSSIEFEIELIALYGRKDLGLGPLVNLTDGGEGVSGLKFSEESKRKLVIAHAGKKLSEEHKKKIGAAGLGNTYSLGFKHTQQTRDKVSAAGLGRKHTLESRKKMSLICTGREANRMPWWVDPVTGRTTRAMVQPEGLLPGRKTK